MRDSSLDKSNRESGSGDGGPLQLAQAAATWSFVYVFFTNGIPFDSPNRSEPCPAS